MFLHSKGNHKQHEKTAHRMGEHICKWNDQWEINLQNIEIVHVAPYQERKQPNQKMSRSK